MGSQQSTCIMVANAFPQDIYVRARSEKITEHHASTSYSGQGQLSQKLPFQPNFNLQARKEGKTTYEVLINAGFSKMPRAAVSTFKPPSNHTKTIYLTVLYYDGEGNKRTIAEDVPQCETHAVIVTATGGILDAKDKNHPWIDLNDKDHKQEPCTVCSTISSVCSLCMVESRLHEIQYSIGVVQDCRLAKSLVQTIEKAKENSIVEKQEEAKGMMEDIEKLAKLYWKLETKTRRAVGNVRVYGETLKEAAEDYLEDGNIDDFWEELVNMDEAKRNLQEANEEHEAIKGETAKLQTRAQSRSKTFQEKALAAEEYNKDQGTALSIISIPVVGQLVGGVGFAAVGGYQAAEWCSESSWTNNLPVKIVAGVAGGAAAGAAGLVTSIVTLPAAPYFWYKSISSNIDAKNYGILKEQFGNIALQMGLVEEHLGKITYSLHEIEQNLQLSQEAERKAISAQDERKRVKMVRRVIEKASNLLQACQYYSSIVNDENLDRALGM